jgi:hypothetical protein
LAEVAKGSYDEGCKRQNVGREKSTRNNTTNVAHLWLFLCPAAVIFLRPTFTKIFCSYPVYFVLRLPPFPMG